MHRLSSLALVSLLFVPCFTARAEDHPRDGRLTIKSTVLGEERVALVRIPAGYDVGDQRYPVLYMTDGDSQIGHTASTVEFLARNGWMPEMIVVGITNTNRTRDLTPTAVSEQKAKQGGQQAGGGGGDRFLQFIETELIPTVERTYRTQPYRVFAGHSLGGLLAIHALISRPGLFNAYLAASPSLWWDDQVTVRRLEEFLKGQKTLDRTLFLTLASEKGGMRPAFDKAREVLGRQHAPGLVWDSMLMEDEHHGSVVLRSYYFGLKKVFDGWQPGPAVLAGSLPTLEEHFKKLSAKYGFTVEPPEELVNLVGYRLLGEGKKDEAIAAFKANITRHPQSANGYDSLGEAYEKAAKLDLARPNYERAVELARKNNDRNLTTYQTNLERVSKALKGPAKTEGSPSGGKP
jgi:predicted alpha/beta superfamily hydrolase